jgi:hypothetical protein
VATSGESVYELQLEACFLFTIETSLSGPPGLTQSQLEDLIEKQWWWISADTDVLLESHWNLVAVSETPPEMPDNSMVI